MEKRGAIRLAGALLFGGFLLNAVVTMFHPSGDEDNHEVIFKEYAEDGAWELIHIGQLLGVLLALAGILVLCRLLIAIGDRQVLVLLTAAAAVITGATFAVLQGLDGVGLKQVTESWLDATGAEKLERLHDAETVRWLEWGFQSYFRLILGATLLLLGTTMAWVRLLPSWLGWLAASAGVLSIVLGVDVGFQGLASGVQDVVAPPFQLALLVFSVGVLATGFRDREPRSS